MIEVSCMHKAEHLRNSARKPVNLSEKLLPYCRIRTARLKPFPPGVLSIRWLTVLNIRQFERRTLLLLIVAKNL